MTLPTKKFERKTGHIIYKLKNGLRVPGASTIAKIGEDTGGLVHWAWDLGRQNKDYRKVRDEAADAGTVGHFLISCHLEGFEPDLSAFSRDVINLGETIFLKFLEYWEREGLKFVASEQASVSEAYKFGGTLDVVGRDRDERLVLIDEKSSKRIYESHLFQLSAYEELWNENNEEKITRRAIFRNGREEIGDTELRWIQPMEKHFDIFKAQLNLYQARKRL